MKGGGEGGREHLTVRWGKRDRQTGTDTKREKDSSGGEK